MEDQLQIQNRPKPKKKPSPEVEFQLAINACSKNKDLNAAIDLFDAATSQNLRLNLQHLNSLLYVSSNSLSDPSFKDSAVRFGFRLYHRALSSNISLNEATVTAVARIAAANGEGDRAFQLVRSMGEHGILPRLRTYDPALFCFCGNGEPDKAYEVEEHMTLAGLTPEEPQLEALLRVSAESGRGDKVYEYLHKLRSCVRFVGDATAKAIEDWFKGERACEVGSANYHVDRLKDSVLRNGGGFHGLGWIGSGKWNVSREGVDEFGVCKCCREQLACVDINDADTGKFADSIASLAMEREAKANFSEFQDWLEKHSDYEAIVDGANIGLYQQNFADGGFSVSQLDAVVKELYDSNKSKRSLIVLHNKRFRALWDNQSHRKLLDEWIDKGVLYTTPGGSNDDWYWLYAAVKLRCLLVTNDEMRDHIFELLGSDFFLKWKERHQVHYTFTKGSPVLHMPPPYSVVIQESWKGSWHVPVSHGANGETLTDWLCITRPTSNGVSSSLASYEDKQNGVDSFAINGKRKERSQSPPLRRHKFES